MGMFDTLIDGEHEAQVKVFYHPVWDTLFDGVTRNGGTLENYYVGDDVPIFESFYHYPASFYILLDTYLSDDMRIAVIRDGKFDGFMFTIDNAVEFADYYDSDGYKIRVSDVNGLKRYIDALQNEYDKQPGERDFVRLRDEWREPVSTRTKIEELRQCKPFAQLFARLFEEQYADVPQKIDDMIKQLEVM